MHSSPNSVPPSPPVHDPFPYAAILTILFVYVILSYLMTGFIDGYMENRSLGLSLQELQALPWCIYEADTRIRCVICLDSLRKGERCRSLPVCNHTFHARCIDLWLGKRVSCPTCRSLFVINSGLEEAN
ncbi:RING-H2 finger protein ATL58 [Euphorbia peplus]|nr:RING-H2 finger protein ATL58 [Euphorbia peplus]